MSFSLDAMNSAGFRYYKEQVRMCEVLLVVNFMLSLCRNVEVVHASSACTSLLDRYMSYSIEKYTESLKRGCRRVIHASHMQCFPFSVENECSAYKIRAVLIFQLLFSF